MKLAVSSQYLDKTHPGMTEECCTSQHPWNKLWNSENRKQQQRVQPRMLWPESLWRVGSCV